MQDPNLDRRIAGIENALDGIEQVAKKHFEETGKRIGSGIERAHALQSRFEDIDKIEAKLFETYAETHPKADRDLLAIAMATDWDFINLPSVKAKRDRS